MESPKLLTLTDSQLQKLLSCEKVITKHARRQMAEENGYERNDMDLESAPGEFESPQKFRIFIRRTTRMQENFSVGLLWLPPEGRPVILLRCNGLHVKNQHVAHHRVPHIHRITMEEIRNEIYEPKHVEQTSAYVNLEGAIPYFLRLCHIQNGEQDFPALREISLFESFRE